MKINVVIGDIFSSKYKADVIFVSTKEELTPAGEISEKIYHIAGPNMIKDLKKFEKCKMGYVKITKSYY